MDQEQVRRAHPLSDLLLSAHLPHLLLMLFALL